MAIKLAVLKSGEDVIANIQEIVYKEDNTRSYIFENPFVVKLITSQTLNETLDEIQSKKFNISFFPWIPLSKEKIIEVSKDWVVTIVEPTETVKKSYEERMNGNGIKLGESDRIGKSDNSGVGAE